MPEANRGREVPPRLFNGLRSLRAASHLPRLCHLHHLRKKSELSASESESEVLAASTCIVVPPAFPSWLSRWMLISPVERLAFEALTTRREAPCEVASGRRGDQLIFCQLLADESGEATCFSARAWRLELWMVVIRTSPDCLSG